jgi:hypothetical protein
VDAYFRVQNVVVDAAWTISAGSDAARVDAKHGVDVPDELSRQRQAMRQLMAATLVDPVAARAFNEVAYILRHPGDR